MEQSLFLVLDFGAVCRLCLSGKLLSNIHEEDEDEGQSDTPVLRAQIALLTGIQVCEGDSLPQKICYRCRHLVDVGFELRAAAARAETLLRDAAQLPGELTPTPSQDIVKWDSAKSFEEVEELFDYLEQPATEDIVHAAAAEVIEDASNWTVGDTENGPAVVEEILEHGVNASATSNDTYKRSYHKKKIKSKIRKYTCELCLTQFLCKEKLVPHIRQHYAGSGLTAYVDVPRPYRCEECRLPLASRKLLLEHHLRHLHMNPFVCCEPGCSFVGKSKESLRHHAYRHGARAYVCESCGAAFRRRWELKQHSIRHADEGERFPCRYCRVVCRNRLTHRTHLQSHERGRRFKCERVGCPKAFFTRADLRVHTRSHDNARIFRCHLCISSYTSQSQLNRHLRQHQQRRVSKCDKCNATFNNYTDYFNHRVGTHGAFQPHKCVGCNQGYQSEDHLEKHAAHCKLALNLKLLLPPEEPAATDLSSLDQKERSLLCSEESSDTLDALLLRNLKPAPTSDDTHTHRSKLHEDAEAPLPADGLLFMPEQDMVMPSYPSLLHSPTSDHHETSHVSQ